MKLIATVKLDPTQKQRRLLFTTLEKAAEACNAISSAAWAAREFGRVPVHHLTYNDSRVRFGLTAQVAVRCIGKVVEAYKRDQHTKHQFEALSAMSYDSRILTWRLPEHTVSIWLMKGRETVSFTTGIHQLELLRYQQGESELVHHAGNFYLYAMCEVPDNVPVNPEGWLGIDLGIAPDWYASFMPQNQSSKN